MQDDERHRIATLISLALHDTTPPNERNAAIAALRRLTGGRDIADLVKEIIAEQSELLVAPVYTPPKRALPWLEYKANHEATVAENERLQRRVAFLELRYEKHRPKPDADGNIPYSTFLIALLAVRKWDVDRALTEFARLAKVDRMEVAHWRERGKVSYYYYNLLPELPLKGNVDVDRMKWSEREIAMLQEYFVGDTVPYDDEIAEDMSKRLNRVVSQWAVHCKAQSLGLLNKRRAGRRLKTPR